MLLLNRLTYCFGMLLCGWIAVPTLLAQGPIHLRELAGGDGLSEATNDFLHRAADGRMYISSLDGTNVYDGHTVRVYREQPGDSLSGYQGTANQSPFFETSAGDIWFGTDQALVKRNGETDEFTSYRISAARERSPYYAFALERDRYLWVVHEEAIFRLDLTRPESFSGAPPVASSAFVRGVALRDNEGQVTEIWGGFWYLPGVVRMQIDPGTGTLAGIDTLYQAPDGRPIPPVSNWLLLPSGDLYATSPRALVVFPVGGRTDFRSYSYPPELGWAAALAVRAEREVWLVGSEGLVSFTEAGGFRSLSGRGRPFPAGQGGGDALYLDRDRPGHREMIWIGRQGRGLCFGNLSANRFTDYFAANTLPPARIKTLRPATENGLFALSDAGWHHFAADGREIHGLGDGGYLFGPAEAPWLIRQGQLFRRRADPSAWSPTGSQAPPGGFRHHMALGSDQWLLARDVGLTLYDPEKQQWYPQEALSETVVVALARVGPDQLATADGLGVIRLHPLHREARPTDTERYRRVGTEIYRSTNLGIITDLVYDTRRALLWVTSTAGLYAIDPVRDTLHHYTAADGLPQTNLQSVVLTPKGELWLGSNFGVFNFTPEAGTTGSRFHFTREEGLSADEFTPGAALRLADGRLCFGSIRGIDVFHPDSLRRVSDPPRPLFRELRLHNRPWRGERSLARTEHIELQYDENTLSFVVAANEYANPPRTRLQFYVQADDNPIDTIELEDNRLTLPNLPPADYRFGFTAASATGTWAEAPTWLSVSITPHWSQTTWFRVLLILLALAVVSLITAFRYRYRLRVQEAINAEERRKAEVREAHLQSEIDLEEQRRRITSRMHNDIGGSLTTLSMLSSRLNRAGELESAKDINEKITRWVKDIRLRFSTFIRVVNPQFDTLQKSVQLLQTYAAQLLSDNDLRVTFDFPSEYPEVRLSPDFRSALWELSQEVLNNILKYADAQEVGFRVRITADTMELAFSDDGKGFVPTPEDYEKGIGLSSLRQLTERYGGSIHYERRNASGTITTCVLHLEQAAQPRVVQTGIV